MIIMLNKVKAYCFTIQRKAIKQFFPVVLFIILYKVVLTFNSVNETLVCDHSSETHWAVFSRGTVYYAVQVGCLSLFSPAYLIAFKNC